jgi:3-oxoacyl-[acyl-carrier-protein] synthase II
MMTDIAVTGIGVICSLGLGRKTFWENLIKAKSGIRKIHTFDTANLRSNVAGFVEDFDPRRFMPIRVYRRMSRISQMAVATSIEALEDSGLELDHVDSDRVAVIMGTAYGSGTSVEDFYVSFLNDGPRGAQPFYFPETVPNAPASHIAMFHGITGPNTTFCQNGISAESALRYAQNILDRNYADIALVGGADELSPILYSCYNTFISRIWAEDDGEVKPRPGHGIVLGEGAGMIILERLDSALKRGAGIYGILKSSVVTGGQAPMGHYEYSGDQMHQAIKLAINKAGIDADQVDQICVSANCSGELDRMESRGLSSIFKKQADDLMVSPIKYLTGDFGGAGIVGIAATLVSLRHQMHLPSVRISNLVGESDIVWHTPGEGLISSSLITGSTFGGGSSSIIFARHKLSY